MKNKTLILSTGLAMFSMFFGSGNLVFPLVVGQTCGGHFCLAAAGILFTGVFVPFLGILAMLFFDGDSKVFFGRYGKVIGFWFPFIALSLMGPFGVLARCITVAHGAFKLLSPETTLWSFSIVACIIILGFTLSKSRIIPLLGSILTPLLLLSLSAIAFFGLNSATLPTALPAGQWLSFLNGVFQGYQTMDLLAAFFFSAFVIKHLKKKEPKESLSIFLKASLVGAGLLSAVYVILVLLGSIYAEQLHNVPPQEMLGFVANIALGAWAAPIICVTVALACLTTAIVLTSLFADFLRKEITGDRINKLAAIMTTLLIAFFTSTLEFAGIARILGPTLEVLYPVLILLTVVSLSNKLFLKTT